jgi:hypothetical protein
MVNVSNDRPEWSSHREEITTDNTATPGRPSANLPGRRATAMIIRCAFQQADAESAFDSDVSGQLPIFNASESFMLSHWAPASTLRCAAPRESYDSRRFQQARTRFIRLAGNLDSDVKTRRKVTRRHASYSPSICYRRRNLYASHVLTAAGEYR